MSKNPVSSPRRKKVRVNVTRTFFLRALEVQDWKMAINLKPSFQSEMGLEIGVFQKLEDFSDFFSTPFTKSSVSSNILEQNYAFIQDRPLAMDC